MVGPRSFKNEGQSEAADADDPSTGVPGFSTKVTPPPTSAVVNMKSTAPTPSFRSKVATLRPLSLDRPLPASSPLPDDEGEVIDLLDSVPPPPPMPGATPDAPTVRVRPPEPPRVVRRRWKGFAAIGGSLIIAALVGWFLSRRHDRTAATPVADASTTQVGSAAPAPLVPSAAVADKGASTVTAPAPSASVGSARKPKPSAPRPSRPVKSRHK